MRSLAEWKRLIRKSDLATAPLELVSERIEGAVVDSVRPYPQYWHGNRIVLDRPPDPQELERWRARHREIFAWRDGQYPAVITWYDLLDVPAPEVADEVNTAMIAPMAFEDVAAPSGLRSVRASGDGEWKAIGELACAVHPQWGDFNLARLHMLRALVERGRGVYVALLDESGAAVAAAGGFFHDGVGRFANVETAATHRRKGCARHVVTAILRELRRKVDDVVIVAETGSAAERLYRSLGFVPVLSIRSLQR